MRSHRSIGWLLVVAAAAAASLGGLSTARGADTNRTTASGLPAPWLAYQGDGRVRIARVDGSRAHAVTLIPAGGQEHPDWSPNGRQIAMDVDFQGIWTVNVDGTNLTRLTTCNAPCVDHQDPAWSPDGKSIAFMQAVVNPKTNTNAGASLRVIDVETKNVRSVTTITGNEYIFAPRWSPDGERLVFEIARFDSDNWDSTVITGGAIATVRADGQGGVRRLTPSKWIASVPDWHPSRNEIVFQRDDNLWRMRADGSNVRPITKFKAPTRAIQGTWTPDGKRIIFTYVGKGKPAAAFVAANGKNLVLPRANAPVQTHPRLQPIAG